MAKSRCIGYGGTWQQPLIAPGRLFDTFQQAAAWIVGRIDITRSYIRKEPYEVDECFGSMVETDDISGSSYASTGLAGIGAE